MGKEAKANAAIAPPWTREDVTRALDQLLHNEGVTKDKVTALEAWITAWQKQTLRQRLRWLLKGSPA